MRSSGSWSASVGGLVAAILLLALSAAPSRAERMPVELLLRSHNPAWLEQLGRGLPPPRYSQAAVEFSDGRRVILQVVERNGPFAVTRGQNDQGIGSLYSSIGPFVLNRVWGERPRHRRQVRGLGSYQRLLPEAEVASLDGVAAANLSLAFTEEVQVDGVVRTYRNSSRVIGVGKETLAVSGEALILRGFRLQLRRETLDGTWWRQSETLYLPSLGLTVRSRAQSATGKPVSWRVLDVTVAPELLEQLRGLALPRPPVVE